MLHVPVDQAELQLFSNTVPKSYTSTVFLFGILSYTVLPHPIGGNMLNLKQS